MTALIEITRHRKHWIRSLESWKITSDDSREQFGSLLRHLFTRYPVPEFMDLAWFRKPGYIVFQRWFIHIGSGKNLRTFDDYSKCRFNIKKSFTKRRVHHFLQAPSDYSIIHAVIWGQIQSLGGNQQLTEAILATRIGRSLENNDFWLTVYQFFINNALDYVHVGPVIDFIQQQKFVFNEVNFASSVNESKKAPHPDFSMKGRTPQSLLRQVNLWHEKMGNIKMLLDEKYEPSVIGEFHQATKYKNSCWRIRQLLSKKELFLEGQVMRHCVASYALDCVNGKCTIWSLTVQTHQGVSRCLTIEVDSTGIITQIRGKHNRLPEKSELDMIKKWVEQEKDLKMGRFIN